MSTPPHRLPCEIAVADRVRKDLSGTVGARQRRGDPGERAGAAVSWWCMNEFYRQHGTCRFATVFFYGKTSSSSPGRGTAISQRGTGWKRRAHSFGGWKGRSPGQLPGSPPSGGSAWGAGAPGRSRAAPARSAGPPTSRLAWSGRLCFQQGWRWAAMGGAAVYLTPPTPPNGALSPLPWGRYMPFGCRKATGASGPSKAPLARHGNLLGELLSLRDNPMKCCP